MKTKKIMKKLCVLTLVFAAILTTCLPGAGALSLEDLLNDSSGLTGFQQTVSLETVGAKGTYLEDGIYFVSVSTDVLMALNCQYRKTSSGLVLDGLDYQDNELYVLINRGGNYFTLSPFFAKDYYVAGQMSEGQLRLSRGNPSDFNNQWSAVANGSKGYLLVNRKSGLVMDCFGGNTQTGTAVICYPKHGGDNQTWTIGRVSEFTDCMTPGKTASISDGLYSITLKDRADKCLNVQYAATAGDSSAKVVLDTENGEANEQFYIKNCGKGRVTIHPKHAQNNALNAWAANPVPGQQVVLATYQPGDECSQWIPYANSDGTFSLMNARTHLFLDDYCLHTNDGNPIITYSYNGSGAQRWNIKSVSQTSQGAQTQTAVQSAGYAPYTGVDYRAQTSDGRRIAACDKAVKMATVLWTAPSSFVTWRSSKGGYNTVTATDGTSGTQFIAGKVYQGIAYSMCNNSYDENAWLRLIQSRPSTAAMTGTFYKSYPKTTKYGIDCSYLVYTALKAGSNVSGYKYLDTASMLKSSFYKTISLSSMLPGDVFLKNGHTMLYMGKTARGLYAVIEANADYSRVVYNEYSKSDLKAYGSYRYAGF